MSSTTAGTSAMSTSEQSIDITHPDKLFRGAAQALQVTGPISDQGLIQCSFGFGPLQIDVCNIVAKVIVNGINAILNWVINLLGDFLTSLAAHDIFFETPSALTYDNGAITGLVQTVTLVIANAVLALIVVIGGLNLMIRPHIGESYQTIAEFIPRFLLGALGANLSLWIITQLIDFSNLGAHFILWSPLFVPQWHDSGLAQAIIVVLAIIAYLVLAIMTVFQIFTRLALLDFLIVLSPLAFVCWILPQTRRVTNWWTGLFGATLVLQPLQLLMISMGITLATHVPDVQKEGLFWLDTVLFQVLILIATFYMAYRLPTLLSYQLFRTVGSSGGGFSAIAGVASVALGSATGGMGTVGQIAGGFAGRGGVAGAVNAGLGTFGGGTGGNGGSGSGGSGSGGSGSGGSGIGGSGSGGSGSGGSGSNGGSRNGSGGSGTGLNSGSNNSGSAPGGGNQGERYRATATGEANSSTTTPSNAPMNPPGLPFANESSSPGYTYNQADTTPRVTVTEEPMPTSTETLGNSADFGGNYESTYDGGPLNTGSSNDGGLLNSGEFSSNNAEGA